MGPGGRNVATVVTPPRSVKTQVVPLSNGEAMDFIDYLHRQEDRLGPLFTLAIVTGLRQGELFGLRWDDIDFANSRLKVRYAMQRVDGKRTFVEPKTERSRRLVSLESLGIAALRSQWHRQLKERTFADERWQEWNLVFWSSIGTPWNHPTSASDCTNSSRMRACRARSSTISGTALPPSFSRAPPARGTLWKSWVTVRSASP